MKQTAFFISIVMAFISCDNNSTNDERVDKENQLNTTAKITDTIFETAKLVDENTMENIKNQNDRLKEVPPDGEYLFDVAFAEWQGKSMGEKVTVIVKGDVVRVIYKGGGKLKAKKGEVLDEGTLMKHKSGVWIIGTNPSDQQIDEVGGCTGGPAIIDFENKEYRMC